jgi:hypothetical protein
VSPESGGRPVAICTAFWAAAAMMESAAFCMGSHKGCTFKGHVQGMQFPVSQGVARRAALQIRNADEVRKRRHGPDLRVCSKPVVL